MGYRIERDTMGEVRVDENRLFGAQTQRSLENFKIGEDRMPREVILAIIRIKLACARANARLVPDRMTEEKLSAIEHASEALLGGELWDEFPLSVYQTGSGTQTNMNVNEVIANFGNRLAGRRLLHPNDDVNMSQSSNDVFPSAMHVSAECAMASLLLALDGLITALCELEARSQGIVKCGRTHLQDATPIAFSQEVSGWRATLEVDRGLVAGAMTPLLKLAIGGTAVGTGLNAPKDFDKEASQELSQLLGHAFVPDENKFHALSAKSEICNAHGALKTLACDLVKIANDIRWLASGPRTGLGEITIPENEPGSSIMPGKVNPTQCEAVTMVAARVMGNDTTITFGASQGNFELNVYMPVTIYSFLSSARLLTDVTSSFTKNCVCGITANSEKMRTNLYNSLMTSTALTPYIGYDNTAAVVHLAHEKNITLREAVLSLGLMSEEDFDKHYRPEEMV